ncbi:MAG TPA: aldehyde ferredoxin oxidoreductase family protein [Syntrophothermus lipocalidus]|nr:aldehyde ferredoxin oxidoreductase family protein [Syntrophothermus lipocalidus]
MLDGRYMRVLNIDLSSGKIDIEDREDLYEYLGGLGLATKLLEENLRYDLDPLAPEQPIILSIGLLSTIYPVVTKMVYMFRSPLTGNLGESYAGGRAALALRYAGYDAVVISGKAERPVYLVIGPQVVHIRKADPLWGTGVEEAGRYLRELEPGRGFRSTLRIGQAGEKLVKFAGVNVDTYRHFGRLGGGAVFGSKNLKAIVIHGDRHYPIPKEVFKNYKEVYQEIYEKVTETDLMEKYHDLGTPVNILRLNAMNALPTRNLQSSTFDYAEELSGEAFAQHNLVRQVACIGCPVGCIHLALHRHRFGEPQEWESTVMSYDHEPIFALGTFLGMTTRSDFLALLEKIEGYGLDAISTGVLLGWATEAFQQGLIDEHLLGTRLEFGYLDGYLTVVDNLVKRSNHLYRAMAEGTEFAARQYGGLDFAMTLGRHEMTGYHTGYGAAFGQAVGLRHSHLDNAGYSFDQSEDYEEGEWLVDSILEEEKLRCLTNCLIVCLFARKVYDVETITKAYRAIGLNVSQEQLVELGERIYAAKLRIKEKLGFDFGELRFPRRFFETPSLHGQLSEEKMLSLLDLFLKKVEKIKNKHNLERQPGQ